MNLESVLSQIETSLKARIPRENMNREEAAEYLGLSVSFLEEQKAKYSIPFCRVGGRVIFRRRDLDKFLEQRLVRSAATDRR